MEKVDISKQNNVILSKKKTTFYYIWKCTRKKSWLSLSFKMIFFINKIKSSYTLIHYTCWIFWCCPNQQEHNFTFKMYFFPILTANCSQNMIFLFKLTFLILSAWLFPAVYCWPSSELKVLSFIAFLLIRTVCFSCLWVLFCLEALFVSPFASSWV